MSQSPEKENPNPNPNPNHDFINSVISKQNQPPRRARRLSLPDVLFFRENNNSTSLNHAIHRLHRRRPSFSSASPPSEPDSSIGSSISLDPPSPDYTTLLSNELLLNVFSKLPISQHVSNSLVCKRWMYLHGRLVQSLRLQNWGFLKSGRVFSRFPNINDIDIVHSCILGTRSSGILMTHKSFSVSVNTQFGEEGFVGEKELLSLDTINKGLDLISEKYPNLRRIAAIGATEGGLASIAKRCQTLQELELHCCGDLALRGITGCRNLQVVKLIGKVDGFYNAVVSDIGLTILAQGCKRLVKLELCGCEGSYDGIKAIGQCCQMLEELTLRDHRMDSGWLAALSFCGNLKTLRLQSCKCIDESPGPDEHLGICSTLEELHIEKCHLRDKTGMKALFLVCGNVQDVILRSCWGLGDDVFATAAVCRRVKLLLLERCSLLTTSGLETAILSWKTLKRLIVVSCNSIKDSEVTPELASLFSILKELKWRPDSKSLLSSNLEGTGMGKKGSKFFASLKG